MSANGNRQAVTISDRHDLGSLAAFRFTDLAPLFYGCEGGVDKCFADIDCAPPTEFATVGIAKLAPHDLRRTCARLCHASGGELGQIQFLLGHVSVQTTERYWAASSGFVPQLTIASGSSLAPKPLGGSGIVADNSDPET